MGGGDPGKGVGVEERLKREQQVGREEGMTRGMGGGVGGMKGACLTAAAVGVRQPWVVIALVTLFW